MEVDIVEQLKLILWVKVCAVRDLFRSQKLERAILI